MAALKLPYRRGQVFTVRLLSKETVYILKSKMIVDEKDFSQIEIDVRREDMTSNHGMSMTMWTTNGPMRLPLLFKSWTPVGYMSVTLEKLDVVSLKAETSE